MMKRLLGTAALVGGFLLMAPDTARAITIGPTCGTCGDHNTTFDISFSPVDATENIYDVTITATYGTPIDYAEITAVGIKVDGENIEDFVSVSGPDGGAWTMVLGSLDNSAGDGCSPNPGEAFACSDADPGASPPGPDTWVFQLDFETALNLSSLSGSFKARFEDSSGAFVGPIISESWTTSATTSPTGPTTSPTGPTTSPTGPVPEPTSLLLLGAGLVLAQQRLRRRFAKAHKA